MTMLVGVLLVGPLLVGLFGGASDVLLVGLGVLTAGSGVLAVTSRQVVHAALWLVVALGGLAGVYLLLGSEVIALVQVLVYVGAVVVLLLFALMLTRSPAGADLDSPAPVRVLAAVVGVGTGCLVAWVLPLTEPVPRQTLHGQAEPVGRALFGSWVLPFEVLSVLLLAALVAAIALSRGQPTAGTPAVTDGADGPDTDPSSRGHG